MTLAQKMSPVALLLGTLVLGLGPCKSAKAQAPVGRWIASFPDHARYLHVEPGVMYPNYVIVGQFTYEVVPNNGQPPYKTFGTYCMRQISPQRAHIEWRMASGFIERAYDHEIGGQILKTGEPGHPPVVYYRAPF